MRLLSEQVGIRLDQVARFLSMDHEDAVALVGGMAVPELRWVRCEVLLEGEEPWVWLRKAGVEMAGTGYGYKKPKLSRLEYLYVVNEVRLAVTAETDGVWVCERELWRRLIEEGVNLGRRFAEGDVGVCVPDSMVEVGGRSYAIQVALSIGDESDWAETLSEYHVQYAATKCFCAEPVRWELEEVREELDEKRAEKGLGELRVFFGDAPGLDDVGIQERASQGRGRPEEREVPLLAVISEHGALRLDQLAQLAGRSEAETIEMVESLEDRGLAFLTGLVPEEPPWLWCSQRGVRLSRTDLEAYTPTLRSLEWLRAVNQVHVDLKCGRRHVRWFSSRVLEREGYDSEGLPSALALIGGETYAIEVVLRDRGRGVLENRLVELSRRCENVLCYTPKGLSSQVRDLQAGWLRNLEWRELPSTEARTS